MKEYMWYLFDADGTLIDTTEMIYQCFRYSCNRFGGREVARADVVRNIGLTLRRQVELYLGPMSDEQFEQVRSGHMGHQLSIYRDYIRCYRGVPETLRTLVARGKTCGVVSSRMKDTLTLYLRTMGILDVFRILVSPEDTKAHKPDAAPVLCALARLGAAAEETVYVGDATFDIESGTSAGVDTAFAAWGHNDVSALRATPTHVLYSPEGLCSVGDEA